MFRFVLKLFLCLLPIAYGLFIWEQSSHFNPESVYMLSNRFSMTFLKMVGVGLELTHLFEFGFLYLFIVLACLSFGRLNVVVEVMAFSIAFLYGVIDEVHQSYVPYRSSSVVDLVKDVIGIFAIWWFVHRTYFVNRDSRLSQFLRKITHQKHNTNI